MNKNLKLFFKISLIVSIIFLILFVCIREIRSVWHIVYGCVGFIGSIASLIGLKSSDSPPPPPPGKTLFDITRIDRSDFIITVNFKSKDELYAIEDINASVGSRDICSINNPQDFPIKSLDPLGQFYVKLRRHSDDDRISDITIECTPKNGPWSEVRHIDVNKLIEAHYKE